MSFNVLKLKQKEKPGDIQIEGKLECYENDTITALNCFKIINEFGQHPPPESA